MAAKPKKAAPSWSDVKARLAEFDRTALLGLVQDLYAASKDNQAFLHARFGLGGDVLDPYKATIDRWLWPDVYRNQDVSVSKAKKAVADYKKASGRPAWLQPGVPRERPTQSSQPASEFFTTRVIWGC